MASQVEASAAAGALIAGKYRLEALLGRGGMGAVYAARHVLTGRRFAIKLLSRELTGDAGAEERFMREAMLASSIQHPAIVEVYDVGRDRGMPYMVMKLLQGETLGERLCRGPLAPDEAIRLLLPVIDGIAAAHAHGIVHRDLKPDNVLIEREGEREHPRVLDFGISKLLGGDTRRPAITRPGMIIGTPDYMAPEQVRGESALDARCDVYALGVMLYEMLTGSLPFSGKDLPALLLAITEGTAPGIRTRRAELPSELESAVAHAMEPDRELRYRDAAELGRALLALGLVRPSQLNLQAPGLRGSSTPGRPPRLHASPPRGSAPVREPRGSAPASGPRSAAPRTPVSTPSTPSAELGPRPTLPPSAGLYAGVAIGALANLASIALPVLPGKRSVARHTAGAPVAANAISASPLSLPVAPAPAAAPAPGANTLPLAAVIAPAPIAQPHVPPQLKSESVRTRGAGRAARSSARVHAAPVGPTAASEEAEPTARTRARVDMSNLTSEILDPFE